MIKHSIKISLRIGVVATLSICAFGVPGAGRALNQPDVHVVSTATSSIDTASLIKAYATARHLPPQAIAGIRSNSLQEATLSNGTKWAIASFLPSAQASTATTINMQDGQSKAIFTMDAAHTWHLTQIAGSSFGCNSTLPSPVASALHLPSTTDCQSVHTTLQQTLSKLPTLTPSGNLGQRIAKIALSQVGVSTTPNETNFNGEDCDPYTTMVGAFSPNVNGCGIDKKFSVQNQNEAWCADFAKWAWQQAGITRNTNTIDAAANSFYNWGLQQGEAMPVNSGTPEPGDAIVFFPAGYSDPVNFADHVGIVASVNPDGTVNLVNGDFLSATEIGVQYNTNVNLSTWPSQIWSQGEQWLLVTPPTQQQLPAPSVNISGPRVVTADTNVTFNLEATGNNQNATYYWIFGDGRDSNVTSANLNIQHVFAQPGTYTVTVTATSPTGAAKTYSYNVDVLASPSTTSAVPNADVWYSTTPVAQYLFGQTSQGSLTAQTWDGSSWLLQSIPGQAASDSHLTSLTYPDTAANDATTPHVYFRTGNGALAQTYLGTNGWTTQTLVGSVAQNSPLLAATLASSTFGTHPAIFYIDPSGHLAESYSNNTGAWVKSSIPSPQISHPESLTLANNPSGPQLFFIDKHNMVVAVSMTKAGWQTWPLLTTKASSSSTLSAVVNSDSGTTVFFVDTNQHLAQATYEPEGTIDVSEIPGTPASTTQLLATRYIAPSGSAEKEVFYTTPAGQPATTSWDGQAWSTITLPGTASTLLGVNGYPGLKQPEELFFTDPTGKTNIDTSTTAGSSWSTAGLPTTIAAFQDRILLYAATPSDYTTALSAANAAGLPSSQVSTSYADIWNHLLSGNYLVTSVGPAATNALFFNACGWSNDSKDGPGSTPFYIANSPLNQLPGATLYQDGAAADPTQQLALATDLAYYAHYGHYPNGVTSLPTVAALQYVCSGQPN